MFLGIFWETSNAGTIRVKDKWWERLTYSFPFLSDIQAPRFLPTAPQFLRHSEMRWMTFTFCVCISYKPQITAMQSCFYPFTPVCTSSGFDQAPPGSSSWQRSPMSSYHTIPFIFRVNTLKLRNFCQFPPSFDFQPVSLCFYLFFCHCFSCVGFLVGRKNLSTLTLTVVLRLMIPPCQLLSRFFTNSM